jgi:hypothetical protein
MCQGRLGWRKWIGEEGERAEKKERIVILDANSIWQEYDLAGSMEMVKRAGVWGVAKVV